MQKAELTAEQAQAMEVLKVGTCNKVGIFDKSELIVKHANKTLDAQHDVVLRTLRELSPEVFATALIVGYTIKRTPEEEIAELYKSASQDLMQAQFEGDYEKLRYAKGFQKGVRATLKAFGIDVVGVNALYAGERGENEDVKSRNESRISR